MRRPSSLPGAISGKRSAQDGDLTKKNQKNQPKKTRAMAKTIQPNHPTARLAVSRFKPTDQYRR
jgi:hypothetical protein